MKYLYEMDVEELNDPTVDDEEKQLRKVNVDDDFDEVEVNENQ